MLTRNVAISINSLLLASIYYLCWHETVYVRYLPEASATLYYVSPVGGFSAPLVTKVPLLESDFYYYEKGAAQP